MTLTHEAKGETRTAIFSECQKYRYSLEITWRGLLDDELKLMQVIGLNPSTADHLQDDPTIRRCKAFARREGCNGLVMTNLFAWRDKSPVAMKKVAFPIGEKIAPERGSMIEREKNDIQLYVAGLHAEVIVAAWGNHGAFMGRGRRVSQVVPILKLKCFRLTGAGEPEHPLYMPADQSLIPFAY